MSGLPPAVRKYKSSSFRFSAGGRFSNKTCAGRAKSSSRKRLRCSARKITELTPGKNVVWHVSDAQLNFVKDKAEWNGAGVIFEIAREGDKIELRFTHFGLVPTFECYGDCSVAWGFYIDDSFRSLIATGIGQPARKQ
jgi:hypothetical protein